MIGFIAFDVHPPAQTFAPCYIKADRAITAKPNNNVENALGEILSSVFVDTGQWWRHSSSDPNYLGTTSQRFIVNEVINSQNADMESASANRELSQLRNILQSYANLPYDWDGYGGYPASWIAISDAEIFLNKLMGGIELPRPMLSGDGTVGLYWDKKNLYISLDFVGDGLYTFLIDRNGDYQGEDDVPILELMPDSLQVALEQVKVQA